MPVFRCDPADYPAVVSLAAHFGVGWTGLLRAGERTLDLADVACAWWRRPGRSTVAPDVREFEWLEREASAGLRGVLSTLPWLNHPETIRAAEHKPCQIATAAQVGLRVPPTLVTNDPDAARVFAKAHGALIYKPLTGGILSDGTVIYASPVDMDTIDDGVRATTHMFQPRITKAYELRITVVGERLFVARIDANSEIGRQDWRADYQNLTYRSYSVPDHVADKIHRFMREMRLRFAAIDMIVTPDGGHVFLEANPNGQWAWIEDETGMPIASAIADVLEGATP
ncbi:ATP-grasp ribosomal peptide maturase [Krasilnikovia sp. M28-CT-15]